jgi:hypothetical protein
MRKFVFLASAALATAAFGDWMSTTTTALVASPANGVSGMDPTQIMVGSPNLPTQHFVDYSFVYPSN